MSQRPWYAFYPADYARDTAHLSMIEHGAYRLLMDHYYSSGEPLSTDVERLLRLCRAFVGTERAAVLSVLKEFFVEGNDGWHHVRIDSELVKAADKAVKCSKAGTISATNRQRNVNGRANGRSTDAPTEAQPSQSQSHIRKESIKEKPLALLADFDEFWKKYPKKAGKKAAFKAYEKARREGTDAGVILFGVDAYRSSRASEDPKYTKNPATWLNQGCWMDEANSAPTSNVVAISDELRRFQDQQEAARKARQEAENGCLTQ